MELILRRLRVEDEAAFAEAVAAWDSSSGFLWPAPQPHQSFSDFVQMQGDQERGLRLPDGYVPATVLYGFSDGHIVGRISIRHRLNDFLLKLGGHIGYVVVPPYRRQGVAKRMLRGALEECRALGLERVLVTCDEDNMGSAKTIESNAGILENIVDPGNGQKFKRRYWISL